MLSIRFNRPEEFIDELRAESGTVTGRVTDKIVRVTCSHRRSQFSTLLFVIATAVVAGRLLVRLEKLAGEYIGDGPDYREAQEKADTIAEALRDEARKLGLEVRAGVFEPLAT